MFNGAKLKELLTAQNMEQQQLAEICGITPTLMSYIISGKRRPSFEVAERAADALGVKIDDLRTR